MRRALQFLLPLLALLAPLALLALTTPAGAAEPAAPAWQGVAAGSEPDWVEASDGAAFGPSIEAAPTTHSRRQPQARGRRTSRLSTPLLPAFRLEGLARPERKSQERCAATPIGRPIRLLIGRRNE